jgi:hypothetical protein
VEETFDIPIPVSYHKMGLWLCNPLTSWAAKYAGLSQHAAVNLVSKNIEDILGLTDQGPRRYSHLGRESLTTQPKYLNNYLEITLKILYSGF